MSEGQEITGADGVLYTVISHTEPYTMLAYDRGGVTCFTVVWPQITKQNGLYSWTRRRDFGEDIQNADRFIEQAGQKNTADRRLDNESGNSFQTQ